MHSGITHERFADFRHGKRKKQKRGEFITPPRPTGRRSNYSLYAANLNMKAVSFFLTHPIQCVQPLQFNDTDCFELMIRRKGLVIWCCTRCNQQ